MRERVNYGSDTWGWTIFWICVFVIVFFIPLPGFFWWMWWCFFIFVILLGLCFMPLSVTTDEDYVAVRHPLKTTKIPVNEIESVTLVEPSTQKSSTSKGFGGYWGKGKDTKYGEYTTFVGKGDERFLIKMKDGKQYMISSNNAPGMVAYIEGRLKKE